MVDTELLNKYIKECGLKVKFICEKLDISRTAFDKKRKGDIPIKPVEMNLLCELFHVYSPDEKTKIFYREVE